jgi:hypothetical protein
LDRDTVHMFDGIVVGVEIELSLYFVLKEGHCHSSAAAFTDVPARPAPDSFHPANT